eukprot:COSAG05_NODE_33_length_28089_cov_31.909289_36_plen_273_part_00
MFVCLNYTAASRCVLLQDNPLEERRPDLTAVESGHPNQFVELIEACWADDPKERPSCTECCEKLQMMMLELTAPTPVDYEAVIADIQAGRIDAVQAHLAAHSTLLTEVMRPYNYTVFALACEAGHAAIVQLLLEKDCQTSVCNHIGLSGWEIAERWQHTAVLQLLEEQAERHAGLRQEVEKRANRKRLALEAEVKVEDIALDIDFHRLSPGTATWTELSKGQNGKVWKVGGIWPPLYATADAPPVSTVALKAIMLGEGPAGGCSLTPLPPIL